MRSTADFLLLLALVGGVVWSKDQSSDASWTSFSLQASSSPWDLDKPWKDQPHQQHHDTKGSWNPSWNSHHSQQWQPKHVNFPSPDIEIHVRAKPPTSYARSVNFHKPVGYPKKPTHTVPPYSPHKTYEKPIHKVLPYTPHKPYEKPNYIPWDASHPIVKEEISPEEAQWYPHDMPLDLIRQSYKWGSQEFDKKFSTKNEDYTFSKNYPSYESKPYVPYEPKPVELYKPKPVISYEPKPDSPSIFPSLYEPIPTPLYYHETSPPHKDKPLEAPEDKPIVHLDPEYAPLTPTIYEPEPDPTPVPTLPPTLPPTPEPTSAPIPPPTSAAPVYVPTTPPATNPPPPPPTTTHPITVYSTTEPHKPTKETKATYKSVAHEPYEPEPYPPYHAPYVPNPYHNLPSLYAPLASPRNYYLNGTPEPKKSIYKDQGKNIRNYYLNEDHQSGDIHKPEPPHEPYQPPVYPTYIHPSQYGHPEPPPPIYDPNYSPYEPSGYHHSAQLPQYPPLHEPPVSIKSYYLSKPAQPPADKAETEGRVGDISKRSSVYGYDMITHQRSSQNKWPFS